MIEGVLDSFFSGNHISEDLRKAYSRVWQHLAADTLDSEDLRRISSAVDFAMKNQFCESCSRESLLVLTPLLKNSFPANCFNHIFYIAGGTPVNAGARLSVVNIPSWAASG